MSRERFDPSSTLYTSVTLKKILESVIDVICTIDKNGIFKFVSASSLNLCEYLPDEMIDTSFLNFIVPEDIDKTVQIVNNRVDGCYTSNFEKRFYRKDGSIINVIWSSRWHEKDGLLYCVARDGSDKKIIENRLEKAQQLARIANFEYDFATNQFTHSS